MFSTKNKRNICLGDSTVILAHGERKFKLPLVNSTREIVLDLRQVVFVPKLTKNLLSLPSRVLMGEEIHFNSQIVSAESLMLKPTRNFCWISSWCQGVQVV